MNKYLEQRINKMPYCWAWTGAVGRDGYGRAYYNNSSFLAHRAVFTEVNGVIPQGMTLDHLCRNKICVNPKHLEITSQRENILRGNGKASINAKKSYCNRGHEFTPENTYFYVGARGGNWRMCRACRSITNKIRRKQLREQ
jgi:hypothetical protein